MVHNIQGLTQRQIERLSWMRDENIRPYVFVRPENRMSNPGEVHKLSHPPAQQVTAKKGSGSHLLVDHKNSSSRNFDWFPHEVIYKNPLEMDQVGFADRILTLEAKAFGPSGMAMPRWVFYDCAIVPGFVAGFAHRTRTLPTAVRNILGIADIELAASQEEWTPLSLFIIIPTMSRDGEWVAHNLCSVNSLLPKEHQFYGIGFISKAFGLWNANIRTNCGMTQWTSPAVRLHAHYGDFEVLTAYTPVHSYSRTLTYRVKVDVNNWASFFNKEPVDGGFLDRYEPAGFEVNPIDEQSLISFQRRLERREGPYFLSGAETVAKKLDDPLTVFRRK